MADKKLASILLDCAVVFGGVLLGAGIKDLKHQSDMLKLHIKFKDAIIETQQKIIKRYEEAGKES